ncbi:hypothetical protein G9F31_05955 [Acinetobacter sp. 187]|uniref:hypothetical protein n=1 Tax=Acinetobacter lanii TaxID=2715163 RepID=UPI00140C2F9A|nr:hypothetical protein [Acinetobacter lanii]NHC03312.1 hypothetical protein [Acinetobacter lanii]
MKKIIILLTLSLLSSYGCTKQNSVVKKINVHNCSYVDEYFDYCKPEFINEYSKLLSTGTVNFNQKFILAPIGNSPNYSGIVAIDKTTGNVETMKFGFKQSSLKKQIESKINSDVFCIDGEVNSKSLSINNIGKSCFKFDNKGFKFLNQSKSESSNIYPIIFGNTNFKCGSKNCEFTSLNEANLNKISKNNSSSLRFITNEKGFDSSYLDASDDKNILYVIRYNEGDNEIENVNLAYFYQGDFKVKLLGSLKSLKIIDSRNIKFNGKDITLN